MTKYADDYSVGELMCVTLAREIEDGDVIVLGSFTPLAYANCFRNVKDIIYFRKIKNVTGENNEKYYIKT